ncbi:hypothetical protein MHK_008311, partial [Candidatus Magnetomorum sp. HK-1]
IKDAQFQLGNIAIYRVIVSYLKFRERENLENQQSILAN